MKEWFCKANEAPGNQEGGRMREQIARMVCASFEGTSWTYCTLGQKDYCYAHADQILALLKQNGYVTLAKDQSLPNLEKECSGGGLYPAGYRAGVEDMLKANFKKVELEGPETK